MPSRAALAAAEAIHESIRTQGHDDLAWLDKYAPIIDAHFAPYLAAVESLRRWRTSGRFQLVLSRSEKDDLDEILRVTLPRNAATLAPGDQG